MQLKRIGFVLLLCKTVQRIHPTQAAQQGHIYNPMHLTAPELHSSDMSLA
jgi:hypothetical protein